jgi:hypothetical protein
MKERGPCERHIRTGLSLFPKNAPDESAMTDKEIGHMHANNAHSSVAQAFEVDADWTL